METVDYDCDRQLTDFITDYSDGKLEGTELEVFCEYMQQTPNLRLFTQKARNGRRALANHYKVVAADDFEEKLAQRIAEETRASAAELNSHCCN